MPGKSSGGRDKPRIAPASEGTLERLIREFYLTPQKPTAARLVREVRGCGGAAQVPVPSANTIRRCIKALSPAARRGGEELPQINPVHGHAPAARHPLDLVQIDHTPVDLILVDPTDREPIGRPWIAVAIDAYSHCLAGFHVTLEAPSATSVGLCLTHAATDKASWLALRDPAVQDDRGQITAWRRPRGASPAPRSQNCVLNWASPARRSIAMSTRAA